MTENEIILFKHEEFGEICTLNIDGEPWFIGREIAEVLGYGNGNNNSKAIAHAISDHVDNDEKKHISYEDFKLCCSPNCVPAICPIPEVDPFTE